MSAIGNGTKEQPLTGPPPDRQWGGKWCRCGVCGFVGISSLLFDFYVNDSHPGTFHCESCLRKEIGLPLITIMVPEGSHDED